LASPCRTNTTTTQRSRRRMMPSVSSQTTSTWTTLRNFANPFGKAVDGRLPPRTRSFRPLMGWNSSGSLTVASSIRSTQRVRNCHLERLSSFRHDIVLRIEFSSTSRMFANITKSIPRVGILRAGTRSTGNPMITETTTIETIIEIIEIIAKSTIAHTLLTGRESGPVMMQGRMTTETRRGIVCLHREVAAVACGRGRPKAASACLPHHPDRLLVGTPSLRTITTLGRFNRARRASQTTATSHLTVYLVVGLAQRLPLSLARHHLEAMGVSPRARLIPATTAAMRASVPRRLGALAVRHHSQLWSVSCLA
jgi:hypothetical protein